jgi:hypothetical protein
MAYIFNEIVIERVQDWAKEGLSVGSAAGDGTCLVLVLFHLRSFRRDWGCIIQGNTAKPTWE